MINNLNLELDSAFGIHSIITMRACTALNLAFSNEFEYILMLLKGKCFS